MTPNTFYNSVNISILFTRLYCHLGAFYKQLTSSGPYNSSLVVKEMVSFSCFSRKPLVSWSERLHSAESWKAILTRTCSCWRITLKLHGGRRSAAAVQEGVAQVHPLTGDAVIYCHRVYIALVSKTFNKQWACFACTNTSVHMCMCIPTPPPNEN